MTDWERDCMKERGRVLTGNRAHYCVEWDGMTVDETCDEFDECLCFKMDARRHPSKERKP